MDWEAWISKHQGSVEIDLSGLESSSALMAALVRLQVKQRSSITLTTVPAGLAGLARVMGVQQRFDWDD